MPEILDWPELEEMSKEDLLKLIQEIRESLCYAEDCCCMSFAEMLKVDVST